MSKQSRSSQPPVPAPAPVDRVREYLATQGFPLEFSAASAFRNAGLTVSQGTHYDDAGTLREIDVVASRLRPESTAIGMAWVTECKETPIDDTFEGAPRVPWVMFSSNPHPELPDTDHFIGSDLALAALWTQASNADLLASPWLAPPGRRAFGGRLCKKADQDPVYSSLQGVVGATRAYAKAASDSRRGNFAFLYLPLLVIRGPLFEAYWDDASGQLVIEERAFVPALWSGFDGSGYRVDVVTIDELPAYLAARAAKYAVIDDAMKRGWDVVVAAHNNDDLDSALKARAGSPYLALPKFLRRLAR